MDRVEIGGRPIKRIVEIDQGEPVNLAGEFQAVALSGCLASLFGSPKGVPASRFERLFRYGQWRREPATCSPAPR